MKLKSKIAGFAAVAALALSTSFASVGAMNRAETRDIVDTAVAAGSFKTLAAALKAAGLIETCRS